MGLEAAELARWTRFAAKGGIGKCIATCDCVAESADDLMFLKDDEITVLLQLPDREGFYLGYCEGVVGRFAGQDVRFTTKLKKPVMTKRSSSMGTVTGNINTNKSPSPTVSGSGASPSPTPYTSISYNPQHGVTHRTSSTPSPSAFRSVSVSSLNSRTRAESLERGGERRGSGIGARHPASPLSTARAIALDNEQEEGRDLREGDHIPNAFATLHEIALAEAAASGSGMQPRQGSVGSRKEYQYTASPFGTPSPHEAQFSRVDSSSERGDSRAGTRTSSPRQGLDDMRPLSTERSLPQGPISPSNSQPLSTSTSTSSASFTFTTTASSSASSPQTSPSSSPPRSLHTQSHSLQQHRYTAHAPSPLTLHPDQYSSTSTSTSPLRITKRSPGPNSALGFANNPNSNPHQMQRSPPPVGALPLVPGSPPATVRTHSVDTSISQTLAAPAHAQAQGLSPSAATFSTGPGLSPGLSPSTGAFSPLSSPSVYSSPPHSAAPTLGSSSSSPSHTATFAHRLGLNSAHGSPASIVDDRYEGDTVGSSPATLAHEDREPDLSTSHFGTRKGQNESGVDGNPQARPPRDLRDTSAAAAGVSIGLSLLEGLIGSYSDDDDSDDDDDLGSQYSDQADDTTRIRRENRVSTVSRETTTASEEGTAEGLGYARSEDSHALHRQVPIADTQPLPLEHSQHAHNQADTVRREPIPHTTQPAPSSDHHLSPATSPTSPSFLPRDTQSTSRERRPSLAPSASSVYSARSGASAATGASGRESSWEGASDIYDDYRYSRASVRPSFDAMSVRSGVGVMSSGGERRPSFDSVGSGPGGYFGGMGARRERMDSGASSSFGGTKLRGLVEGIERDDRSPPKGGEELRDDEVDKNTGPHEDNNEDANDEQDRHKTLADVHAERLSQAHNRSASADSDVSVYTQNSRLSTLSRDLALGGVLAGLASATSQGEDNDHRDIGGRSESPHGRTRPPPLTLSASEPLLHTTWGSAVSSPGMSPPGISAYTPVAGALEIEGRGLYSPGGVANQRSVGLGIGSREDDDGGLRSPNTIAGFASAMRMRLEEDRLARAAETQNDDDDKMTRESQYENTGLGSRIVIEDEDELPSRIANETFDSQADTTSSAYQEEDVDVKDSFTSADSRDTDATAHNHLGIRADSRVNTTSSSSPEPEILGGLALGLGGRLVVTNRTPSPSLLEGALDDGRLGAAYVDGTNTVPVTNLPSTSTSTMAPTALTVVSPPIPSQTPSSSPSPAPSGPSHLRPSLADLREPTGAPLPGTNQRRSLFLPHPNAPKAPAGLISPGPMYIAAQQQPPGAGSMLQGPSGPNAQRDQRQGGMPLMPYNPQNQQQIRLQQLGAPRPGVLDVIQMALTRPPQPAGPARAPLHLRGPTIYGRTEAELGAALGPVPIVFSVEPPPPGTGNGGPSQGQGKGPQSGAPPTSPPRVQMMTKGGASKSQAGQPRQPVPRSMSVGPGVAMPSISGPNSAMSSNSMPSISNAQFVPNPGPGNTTTSSSLTVPGTGDQKAGPLPRANFFPKAPGLRPRSRSFSGFNSTSAEVPVPLQRSREDAEIPSAKEVHRSLTGRASSASLSSSRSQSSLASPSSTSSNSTPGNASSAQTKPGSAPLRPSPLSLSHLSNSGGLKPSQVSPILKSPSSPLAQSVIVPPTSQAVSAPQSPEISLSPPPNSGRSGASAGDTINSRATYHLGETPSRVNLNEALLRSPPSMRPKALFDAAPSETSSGPGRTPSLQVSTTRTGSLLLGGSAARPSSPHSMMDLTMGEPRAEVSPPASIVRQTSLRSKLSLPNLRRKQSRQDDDSIVNTIASPTSPTSIGPPTMHDPEMLQVKDMEFELVRPNLAHHFSQAARTSEDSGVLGREGSFDLRQENNAFLRAESPAFSVSSGGGGAGSSVLLSGQRSPTIEGGWSSQTAVSAPVSPPPGTSRPPTDSESSMDAHRQRELKWMALMAANPASNARKSKKVRKLVVEGVPSSVRYLVWSYLTDGKARCVPNVYAQLCARGKVGVADRIEEDIRRGFGDTDGGHEQLYSHLRGTQGPVGTLLSAYLNMVPDVQYSIGLTLIVGQLLLLSPEEDAFWIFVSIMDTHIRPYFYSSTTQMEVDAALFSRALENNDPQVARKVLVDMGILPTAICQPWFSTLFVGTLPPEYLNRVWDLFLFEGVPFLVRVALALMQCCRRRILESTSDESVLHVLRHPPPSSLPPTPDAFLALAFGVKHKDDDMRKQRVKMEAQVKRQTQVPRTASTSGIISLPRT